MLKTLWEKIWAFLTVWTEEQMADYLNKTGRWTAKKK